MSNSTYALVIWGYRFDHQLLEVSDGIEQVCSRESSHGLPDGARYCPVCGTLVKKQVRMVPSPTLLEYAARYGLTPEEARLALKQYQHELPRRWYTSGVQEEWVFGVSIISEITSACLEFESMDAPSQLKKFEEANRLFTGLGLDPKKAKYYLLAEL